MTGKIEQWVRDTKNINIGFDSEGNQFYGHERCDDSCKLISFAREWDAEIEALTRRNAELTAALGDAEDAWIDSDVHPRDAAGTCEHCDRIAAIFAALTPTESEQ